jgi:DNA-binding MarR family transcriptional regulator
MPTHKARAPSELEKLDRLLVQICHLHHARAQTLFEAIGVYRGQPPVLEALWQHDGLTHTELAAHLHVRPATITRMVQRMEHAGFLECRPDPDDQRVSRVYLTSSGRNIRSAIKRTFRKIQRETLGDLSVAERAQAGQLLTHIRDNLADATGLSKEE